jgi:DNA polymerase-1
MFCAENDDYLVAEADYTSAEMWVMAYQCEDNNMLADLEQGDFHRRTAGRILNKPFEQVTDYEKTYIGKRVNFGIPYGIGAEKLSNRRTGMGCTVYEAQERLAQWHAKYDRYRPWTQKLVRQVKETGELIMPTGRKRRFRSLLDPKQSRQLVNAMVQGPAGDYTLTSLIQLHELLKQYKSYAMFVVHDSVVFQLHKQYLGKTIPLIHEVMESHRWDGFPDLKVEFTIGPNWLYQEKVNRKDYGC